jgi:hypothetical protein
MKTMISSANKNRFRNAIACFAVAATLFTAQAASAQTVSVTEDVPAAQQTGNTFKAAIYPVYNSLFMKVHVENPARETVTITIQNSNNSIVYKKIVGKDAIFHGKFDVSHMANGEYTMTVQSVHHKYSNNFTIQTHQERTATALASTK